MSLDVTAPRGWVSGASACAEALLSALCIWVAGYYTPAGALVRSAVARVRGHPGITTPLLSYYTTGLYESARSEAALQPMPLPPVEASPRERVVDGVDWLLHQLSESERTAVLASGVTAAAIPDRSDLDARLSELEGRFGSPDAAVVAFFAGGRAVEFAQGRLNAKGVSPTIDNLAKQMPPALAPRLAMAARALSLARAFELSWPLEPSARVTSPFGLRVHPILGVPRLHTGVDLSAAVGTPVRAVDDGVVRRASTDAVNGNVIIVDHGRGVSTAYCHNSLLRVQVGDHVDKGQVIALSGSSGRSTGPHLHYQLDLDGVPVDPLLYRPGGLTASGIPPGGSQD